MALQQIPIDDLELDVKNPRIRKWVEMYGDSPNAEQIYLALGAGSTDPESSSTTFTALQEAIRTHGGLISPIIVNRQADGRMVVIEGNTRLAIYKSFREERVPGKWDKIPAIVHNALPPLGIDAIRLQAHLVGPRPWDPYSKAKYLSELRHVYNVEFTRLVDLCGGKKREVQDFIDAYADMEKHYRKVLPEEGAFDASRFSAFVELQKPAIRQAVINGGFTLDDFARWVHERKIDPLQTVRELPRILANDAARQVFLKDGTKEAIKLLYVPPPQEVSNLRLEQLCQALIERLHQLSFRDIQQMRKDPTSGPATRLAELQEVVNDFCNDIAGGD